MGEIELEEALYTTRAMRRLHPDPVPEADLRFVIDAATQAPSAKNAQTWAFVVVRDAGQRRRIADLYRRLSDVGIRGGAEGREGLSPETQKVYRNALRLAEALAEVPVLIVACMREPLPELRGLATAFYGSIFPAIQNLMLAARSRGLGSTLTTLHVGAEEELKRILEIPAEVQTVALIPLGYPKGEWGRPLRRPSSEVTHWDRWGHQR